MGRLLRFVLIAAAALFAQHAAQLHAFSHIERELGRAEAGGASAPLPDHPEEQCLAFDTLGCALPGFAAAPLLDRPPAFAAAAFDLPLPRTPRLEFLSRAPPARS